MPSAEAAAFLASLAALDAETMVMDFQSQGLRFKGRCLKFATSLARKIEILYLRDLVGCGPSIKK